VESEGRKIWFYCGSGFSFFSQCGSGSGSREENWCGSGGQILKSQKVEFLHEKAFLKGRKPGLFVHCGQFPCSWSWWTDPQSLYGSDSRTAKVCLPRV
jgi:hypothetical protein